MALIKTALELALERTENVKGDPNLLLKAEAKQRGKKLAGDYLDDFQADVDSKVFASSIPAPSVADSPEAAMREAAFELLLSQVKLPELAEDVVRLKRVGKGLGLILAVPSFEHLFAQLIELAEHYLNELEKYENLLRKQYEPTLRQKEQELASRTGRVIKLDPMQDPEFVKFRNENIQVLREGYEQGLEQVREKARELYK